MAVGLVICFILVWLGLIWAEWAKRLDKLQVLQGFLSKTKTCFVVGRPQKNLFINRHLLLHKQQQARISLMREKGP